MNGNVCGGSGAEILLSVMGVLAGLAVLIVSRFGSAFGIFLLTACCARLAVLIVKKARDHKRESGTDV